MDNNDEFDFLDEYEAENVKPIRSRAEKRSAPESGERATLAEESFDDLYSASHEGARGGKGSDMSGRDATEENNAAGPRSPEQKRPLREPVDDSVAESGKFRRLDFGVLVTSHMPKIAFGLVALLGLTVGYLALDLGKSTQDAAFGSTSVIAVPANQQAKPTDIIANGNVDTAVTASAHPTPSFSQASGDFAEDRHHLAQVREAKLLAANNSKAMASLSTQLVELHQKVNGQIGDLQMAQQSTIEVGGMMMELRQDLASIAQDVNELTKAVEQNSASLVSLKARNAPYVARSREQVTQVQVVGQKVASTAQELAKERLPEYKLLNDYEILAMSSRGALVRQISNRRNRFFLLKDQKYDHFGRVIDANTTDKVVRGVFPDGSLWVIKGI